MGHVGGRRFSVGELHAASKISSANGSHLNIWDFDISAAEFPQQKKTRVFGVNRPLVKVWKNVCKLHCIKTLHQRFPGKLRESCHNVERKLWKCCLLKVDSHYSVWAKFARVLKVTKMRPNVGENSRSEEEKNWFT